MDIVIDQFSMDTEETPRFCSGMNKNALSNEATVFAYSPASGTINPVIKMLISLILH